MARYGLAIAGNSCYRLIDVKVLSFDAAGGLTDVSSLDIPVIASMVVLTEESSPNTSNLMKGS